MLPMNFRDVGVSLAKLGCTGAVLPGRLLRCGLVDWVQWEDICQPSTVINLRQHADAAAFPSHVVQLNIAAENSVEKYNTADKAVAAWVAQVLQAIATAAPPVLIHCRSGKDRTGVIVAALLRLANVPDDIICQEFMLSPATKREHIELSLAGFSKNARWQRGCEALAAVLQQARKGVMLAYLAASTRRWYTRIKDAKLQGQGQGQGQGHHHHAAVLTLLVDFAAHACATEPSDYKPWGLHAWALEQMGERDAALASYDKAIAAGAGTGASTVAMGTLAKRRAACAPSAK